MNKTSMIKATSMLIGGAGAMVAAYNIVADGKMHAQSETLEELGDDYTDIYLKSGTLSKDSNLQGKLSKYIAMRRIYSPLYEFMVKLKNYAFNFAKETFENIDTLLLSAVAIGAPMLLNKKVKAVGKSAANEVKLPFRNKVGIGISAIAAGILLLDGARVFIHDIWGVGKKTEI